MRTADDAPPRVTRRPLVAMLLMLLIGATPAAGQQTHNLESDFTLLSANALIGGASASVVAWLRGEDVSDAFMSGALGGALSFGGRRLAVSGVPAAGLMGRQVAAIGHGIVVDAGRGAPLLSEIWLPIGPAQVRVPSPRAEGVHGWDARVDLMSAGAIVYAVSQPELEIEWSTSAEAGTLVFRAPRHRIQLDDDHVNGIALVRLVLLSADATETTLDHEVVHVIQQDFIAMTWSYPAEEWLRRAFGLDRDWVARFPVGGAANLVGTVHWVLTGRRTFVGDWMEDEAYSLARHPVRRGFLR